jgi:predicted N-acetyltransferase YhbS
VGEVTIEPAKPGDIDAVVALWTEAFMTGDPEGVTAPYSRIDFDDTDEVATIFVARDGGGEVIGTISLFDPTHEGINGPGEAELARLAVTHSARGRGVGRALVEHVHVLARERGNRAMVLWSGRHQTDGHRLYESLGYVRAPARDTVGEGGRERLVFVKELDAG